MARTPLPPPDRRGGRSPAGASAAGLVTLVLAALLLVGAAAALVGPAQVGRDSVVTRLLGRDADPPVPDGTGGDPEQDGTLGARAEQAPRPGPWSGLGWLPWLVLAVVLALLVRRLVHRPEPDGHRAGPTEERRDGGGREDGGAGLRRAAHRGAEALRAGGDPRDGVVACWLALEEAAARAGTRHRPAQTPTEFTVEVLGRHGVDAGAVAALLALYHRARFGRDSPTREDVAAAAAALDRVAAGLPG